MPVMKDNLRPNEEGVYTNISQDEFDDALAALTGMLSVGQLLLIEGVYLAISEEYNNEILDMALRYQITGRYRRGVHG